MASNVRKLAVEILGDASGAQKAMRSVEESSDNLGENMKRLGKGIAGAFASQQIAAFAKDAVGAAMEDAKAQALLAQQLKATTNATADQIAAVEQFIEKTQNSTGVLDDELRPALATFVRFTGDASKAQDLLTLAMDISAGTGKDLGTVSTALARAYAGNTGALARLGIQTKDASGKALEFDEIQQQLNKTFGGQTAAAADTAAGKMKIAQANFESLKEEVGFALIPVMGQLVDVIMPVVDLFNSLPDNVQQVIVVFGVGAVAAKAMSTSLQGLGLAASTAQLALLPLAALMLVLNIRATQAANKQRFLNEYTSEYAGFLDDANRANAASARGAKDGAFALDMAANAQIALNKEKGETISYAEAELRAFRDLARENPAQAKALLEQASFTDMLNGEKSTYLGIIEEEIGAAARLNQQQIESNELIDEQTEAVGALTEAWKIALGIFDQKAAWNNVTESVDKLNEAAAKAFGDPSQENLRKYEEQLAAVYGSVAAYIEVLGDVPADKQTLILAKLNTGDIAGAVAILDALTKERTVPLRITPGVTRAQAIQEQMENRAFIEALIGVPLRANGGPVTGGMPYVVGERGPELFVPSSSGSIVPRIPATIGAGGGSTTVNVTVTSANPDDVVAAIKTWVRRNGQAPLATTTGVRY